MSLIVYLLFSIYLTRTFAGDAVYGGTVKLYNNIDPSGIEGYCGVNDDVPSMIFKNLSLVNTTESFLAK